MTVSRSVSWANGDAVTPSDTTELRATSIYVGGAGDLAVEMAGGGNITFSGVGAGSQLFIEIAKVLATGTTATNIVVLS